MHFAIPPWSASFRRGRVALGVMGALAAGVAGLHAQSGVTITTEPMSQTVTPGGTCVFSIAATSSAAVTYQWAYAGSTIAGATAARLVVANAGSSNAGNYTCVVSSAAGGSATSWPATLTVAASSDPGRITNLSVLTNIVPSGAVTVGFTTGGAGTSGSQTLLLRAIGPSLSAFGLSPVVSDPTLTITEQDNKAQVAANDNWGTNAAQVTTADAATGAFTLTSTTSLDAALVATLPSAPHLYTAQVAANGGGSGAVLTEFYDDSGAYSPTNPRLINVSALANVATGSSLSAGFVLSGNTAKTVLIRAVGPTLSALGVGGLMADPKLTLFQSQGGNTPVAIATNTGWGGDPQLAAAATAVGAFALGAGSADSVLLITLLPQSPGGMFNYSAQAGSAGGGGGNVLIEVYELP
jgi:hypothetical protein